MMDDKKLLELTRIIHEMVLEVGELKERVAYLEDHIQSIPVPKPETPPPQSAPFLHEGNSKNLSELYREGYHICPVSYGQKRDGDCLFCIALMRER